MSDSFSLKDHLFNPPKVTQLASEIQAVFPEFPKDAFITSVVSKFPDLELKQRISHITQCLHELLPLSYPEALTIILNALPPILDEDREDDDFGDFIHAPYGDFVASYGSHNEYLQLSFEALEQITMRFSVEFAIRIFAKNYPHETFAQMQQRATHPNYHVRRLASEGSRPSLPRGKKIDRPIDWSFTILEQLRTDPTTYVTRSVANHLNDLSKIQPDLVIATLQRWKLSGRQDPKRMDAMIRHALRTQIKAGYGPALDLIGRHEAQLDAIQFTLEDTTISVGNYLSFQFSAVAQEKQSLHLTYTIFFASASGRARSKIFVLCDKSFETGEQICINKKHMMKNFSTRKLYLGKHRIEIASYGKVLAGGEFLVIT